MNIRITAPGFLIAALCGAALVSSPLVTAPPAHAACDAGQVLDGRTGICWSQSQTTLGVSGTGGTCLPGRLGLCMAGLQNSQMPGANLPVAPPAGPAPSSWP
ncbi:hypothetical protein ORI20_21010 [Mycobacterium sp. CVI_P3]|uniref:Secreted protein n=1 Tax=Mycobacterium pinniadriaticum TaxID=2994102 RepID=A0ABT3SI51_9MYCO|nr:hypothetical protein [Mycobacterium pinniadriaticum]MCX2932757.1 hypothetical protein [Mycobacterium pinniadriaticum]MCX2939183.1 hypothetical protein [Mycobacterium pinniadriaticum]